MLVSLSLSSLYRKVLSINKAPHTQSAENTGTSIYTQSSRCCPLTGMIQRNDGKKFRQSSA